MVRHICVALAALGFSATACAGEWALQPGQVIHCNEWTTVTLVRNDADHRSAAADPVYIKAVDSAQFGRLPEAVQALGNKALVPVFPRSASASLIIRDGADDQISTISLSATPVSGKWQPTVSFLMRSPVALAYVNDVVTPTLALKGGRGEVPPACHLELKDHRGRTVLAQFFNSFDLQAGLETIKLPAPGRYDVSLKMFAEPVTSMPRAMRHAPVAVPFGLTADQFRDDIDAAAGITTASVMGSRVVLEPIPTTATLEAEDHTILTVVSAMSNEFKLNKWPFVMRGLDDIADRYGFTAPETLDAVNAQLMLGSNFAPVHVQWSQVQTGPQSFNWAGLQHKLTFLRSNSVRPIVELAGTAAWNQQYPWDSSETLQAWQRGLNQLGTKFRPIMWGLDLQLPTELPVSAAQDFIKASWRGFLVESGKLMPGPPIVISRAEPGFDAQFIRERITTETASLPFGLKIDAPPIDKLPDFAKLEQELSAAVDFSKNMGPNAVPVWMDKLRIASGVEDVTDELQANYLVRAHVLGLASNCYKLIWNSLIDAESTGGDGLFTLDFEPKPAAASYNVMAALLSGASFISKETQGTANVYKFAIPLQTSKWPGFVYVAWTNAPGQTQDILLQMMQGGGVYAIDYLGAEVSAVKIDETRNDPLVGTFKVPVGFHPVFIWDAGKPGSVEKQASDTGNEE